jgi:hypothetical protein
VLAKHHICSYSLLLGKKTDVKKCWIPQTAMFFIASQNYSALNIFSRDDGKQCKLLTTKKPNCSTPVVPTKF